MPYPFLTNFSYDKYYPYKVYYYYTIFSIVWEKNDFWRKAFQSGAARRSFGIKIG